MRMGLMILGLMLTPLPVLAADELSLAGASETFHDTFAQAPHWRAGYVQTDAPVKPLSDPAFSWAAGYIWDHPAVGVSSQQFRAWTSNNAADADPNGDMIAAMGKENAPLVWSGTLHLTVRKMPEALAKTVGNLDPHDYIGAAISSFPYAQRYGIFAISAKLPRGKGVWPAFWLLPADTSWPPEIDIFEVLGSDTSTFYTTLHTQTAKGHESQANTIHTADLSADFHEYAVDWGPEEIRWYFDRKLVFSQPTPPALHQPCYMIANLAVGKPDSWGGAPDASTVFPATMEVASIRVWQRTAYLQH